MQLSTVLTSFSIVAAIWACAQPPLHAETRSPTPTAADHAVLDMAQAYKQRNKKRMAQLLPQARGSILEPWAAYWELSARLDSAGESEIQEFFNRYKDSYQADRLRNDWLLQLGRNGEWGRFNREYPKYRMGDDRSVQCYALLAAHLSNGAEIRSADVANLWLNLKEADDGCASAAEEMLKSDRKSSHIVWQRARLGMENDKLRVATQAVAMLNPDWTETVTRIYLNPRKYLDDKLTAVRPRTKEFVSLALIRLAYQDPTEAADEINHLRWKLWLTPEEKSWIWGVIGKRSAQKLSWEAINYFSNAKTQWLHDDHLAWMVRAAIRTGRWSKAQEAVESMSESQRKDSTWVYWRARAMLQQAGSEGGRTQAIRLLESIAGVGGFYEQLAREELGYRIEAPDAPSPLTNDEKENARKNPGLQRAIYAIQIGLRADGVREWNYTTNLHERGGMSDRNLMAAADLACRYEIWDRCISSSNRTKRIVDLAQRFPMPFKNAVIERSQQIGIDPAYVYGLVRQESRFIMDAQSHVGASGLMQVMPATAKWTAKKIGLNNFTPSQINDRDTNIAIGTGYLKMMLDNFGGSMPMAAAAYNAGPGRPRQWRGQSGDPVLEAAIWAENIPFTETRDYVKHVLSNTVNYALLITGQPQSLKARLGTIGPRIGPETGLDLP